MKMKCLLLSALMLLCNGAPVSESIAGESDPPFTLPDTAVFQLQSKANGRIYPIYVRWPKGHAEGNEKYPLVLLQDAPYAFPIAVSVFRRMGGRELRDAVVVGIGYAEGDEAPVSRTRDYTPTHSPNEPMGHSKASRAVSGGAAAYVKFLAEELLPLLQQKYRIDPAQRVFVGHSFGGLLGAHVLFTRPRLFSHYVLGSPSLWYDNKVIFRQEAAWADQNAHLPAHVVMLTGAEENAGVNKMVDDMQALADALRRRHYPDLNLQVRVLPDQTHLSVFPALLSDALRLLLPMPAESR